MMTDPLNKTFTGIDGEEIYIREFIDYQGTNLDPFEAVRRGQVHLAPKDFFRQWYEGAALHIHDQELHEACKALLDVETWTSITQWLAVDVVASIYRKHVIK